MIGEAGEPEPAIEPSRIAGDADERLLSAGVQFLEALAEVISANGSKVPPQLSQRAASAIRKILDEIEGD